MEVETVFKIEIGLKRHFRSSNDSGNTPCTALRLRSATTVIYAILSLHSSVARRGKQSLNYFDGFK